jgi:hypothetical protein
MLPLRLLQHLRHHLQQQCPLLAWPLRGQLQGQQQRQQSCCLALLRLLRRQREQAQPLQLLR